MESNRPDPTTPGTENEWVLAPPDLPRSDGGSGRSLRRRTVGVVAGLAVGAMIMGGVMASDVLSGVDGDDSAPASSDTTPKATLVDTTQSPPASMPKSDDDGEESEAGM